jgi:hypothetical protein
VAMMQSARVYDEVADFFASGPSRKEISAFRLPDWALTRLRQLLLKKSSATLADDEADELDECVHIDRVLLLIRARALEEPAPFGA